MAIYQRDIELRRRINAFLEQAFELPADDYYGRLDLKKILLLKSALSDINNALTMQLTMGFLEWVAARLPLDADSIARLRNSVRNTKPSSNGYDVYCAGPLPFVAEVKCNIPVNGGGKYGAAQRLGILRDIEALRSGKSKALAVEADFLRFMVFMDLPEVRAANANLFLQRTPGPPVLQFIETGAVPDDPTVIYGVYATLAA